MRRATVRAVAVVGISPNPGSAPAGAFRFGARHYQFDWRTKGFPKGSYNLLVSVAGDPVPHDVPVIIR